jgi:hypothetical protein
MTLWSLTRLAMGNFGQMQGFDIRFVNGIAAAALVSLALYLAVKALLKLRVERRRGLMPDVPTAAGD